MTTEMIQQSLFPPKSDRPNGWGIFGYPGAMVDRAIAADNADQLAEAIERDWIDRTSTTFFGHSILQHCINKGAVKCVERLKELGWSPPLTSDSRGAEP